MQLHSSTYHRPAQLPPGAAMVVGAGNSGAQIALELSASRDVVLAGRSVGSLPRRFLGRDIFDWLWPTVMRPGSDTFMGRRLRARLLRNTDALIGMSENDLSSATLRRVGRVAQVQHGRPVVDGGERVDVRSVVWCTGFRPNFQWIQAPVFSSDGYPVHQRGITARPGLFFLGLRFLYRLNSSLIGGVGADAEHVVAAAMRRTRFYEPTRR